MPCHAIPCHPYHITPTYTHTHVRAGTHTASIMYRMYTLIIIKPTCYIITAMQSSIYRVCARSVFGYRIGIEVNGKLFCNRWCENVEWKWMWNGVSFMRRQIDESWCRERERGRVRKSAKCERMRWSEQEIWIHLWMEHNDQSVESVYSVHESFI